MIERTKEGKRGHLLWIPVGLGKTLIVLYYVKWLIDNHRMPKYFVYTTPPSAIDNTVKELEAFGLPVRQLDMTKKGQYKSLEEGVVNLILHDHLRLNDELTEKAPDTFVVVDEFHKTLNKTQRTSRALEMIRLSDNFIGLSGTVIADPSGKGPEDLVEWLSQIVEFEVTVKNFWVAVGAMISKKVMTRVKIVREEPIAPMTLPEQTEYHSLVPVALGGTNDRMSAAQFRRAVEICREACYRGMVELCLQLIQTRDPVDQEPIRVFMIAKDVKSQAMLKERLVQRGLPEQLIYLITKNTPLTYRPEDTQDYRVVITTYNHSTGYTLTKLRVMITSVYFTNEFTREQLEGRLNRIGQNADSIRFYTVHSGLLSATLDRYDKQRNISDAMKSMADPIYEFDRLLKTL
jgi:hypothetical protein